MEMNKKTLDPIKILLQNRLTFEKRDIYIYHHKSKGSHLISHGNAVSIQLQSVLEGDCITLSIVAGPGNLERKNIVELPEWMKYEFLSE